MRMLLIVSCVFSIWRIDAAEVLWNCFKTCGLVTGEGVGCYYYDYGYSSPEIGIRYLNGSTGMLEAIDGNGSANVGWNIAIWVDAVAGDVLDREYFTKPHHVLKDSYNDSVPEPIVLNNLGETLEVDETSTLFLAVIGNYYDDNGQPCDYYGWLKLNSNGVGLELLESAFSYGELIVGGGAASGPIPEPSSALLAMLGLGFLALRRRCREQLPC